MENIDDYKEIPIYNKDGLIGYTKVDKEDFEKYKNTRLSLDKDGYAKTTTKRFHRLILEAKIGEIVDHINHDKLDNRKVNLRIVTASQNSQNKNKIQKENTSSKFIGVSLNNKTNKWRCIISIDGKTKTFTFESENHAAYWYDQLALKHYGEGAKINNVKIPDGFVEPNIKQKDLPIGVSLEKRTGKYIARITSMINSKRVYTHLGTFQTIEEASNAYNNAKIAKENKLTKTIELFKVITTSKNEEILVDKECYLDLNKYSWSIKPDGYACAKISGKTYLMHRYLLNAKNGEIIDHINGNKLDNKKLNLRYSNPLNNAHNKTKLENTTSKYIGVHFYKNRNKYVSTLTKAGKKYHLGYFETEKEAAKAYNTKAIELYGEFANLNDLNQ